MPLRGGNHAVEITIPSLLNRRLRGIADDFRALGLRPAVRYNHPPKLAFLYTEYNFNKKAAVFLSDGQVWRPIPRTYGHCFFKALPSSSRGLFARKSGEF